MKDKRNYTLASQLLEYSVNIQPGETLYLETKGKDTLEIAKDIIKIATEKKAVPFWYYNDESLTRHFIMNADVDQVKQQANLHMKIIKESAAYIGIRGSDNPFDLADISQEKKDLYNKHFGLPVHLEQRVKHTKWVVLRYPNNAMAQLAETSQEKFEQFYFDVCCLNYQRMSDAMEKLLALMNRTDKVEIKGPGTDLSFSIKGIPGVKCDGHRNIPDGEVYTAPVRDSVNGIISYNTPSLYQGNVYTGITLEFKNGKIVKANADGNTEKLNKIFDTDEGARYIGEFAIGVNPFIREPMKDTLFDEKIAGSFHFTPGQCYDEAPNGNQSSIHWDLVQIQRSDYSGGEMWFDGKLVRKDGVFVNESLEKAFSKANLST